MGMCVCVYACELCVGAWVCVYVCMCVCVYGCMGAWVWVHGYVCMCVCVYVGEERVNAEPNGSIAGALGNHPWKSV